jgi:hypothetical protein
MAIMTFRSVGYAFVALLVLAGCESSTGPDGYATEDLVVDLAVTPHHFHIWETMGVFTVSVVDPEENPVTNFEEIRVERRREGAANWGSIALEHDGGGIYVGEYVFESSGDYELRVTGMRPSDDELKVMLEVEELLEVVRAHSSAGGYRVDFEAVPGHIHAGDASTLNFWFADTEAAHAPPAAQTTGLAPTVLIGVNGSQGTYTAAEPEAGHYTATHTFTTIGTVPVTIRYTGEDQAQHDYTINIIVHAPH